MRVADLTETRQIHPRALVELGEEACIVALGVARDLRSGVIPARQFNMDRWCGTACCIAGHIGARIGIPWFWDQHCDLDLFESYHPSDPILAADAIERYVYLGSETPWRA